MEAIKKFLAYIFAVLFVLTAVFALILINFDRRAFRAETYQKVFATEDFYNRIPNLMADAMVSSSTDFQRLPLAMQGMSTKAWADFFRRLLPPELLKLIGDDTLNKTFDYLNMKSDTVTISLLPIKANMGTDSGVQAVFELLRTQPDCTVAQIAQMTLQLFKSQSITFCNPPEQLTPILTPLIQTQLQAAALVIPNDLTLVNTENQLKDPRSRIQNTRTLMKLSPILPIGFLMLLTFVAVNSLQSWLTWWGVPLLSTGLISMIIGVTGSPIIGTILKLVIQNRANTILPSALTNYAGDLASAMVGAILKPVFWDGLILLFIGLGMVLVSIFIRRKPTQKLQDVSEAKTII